MQEQLRAAQAKITRLQDSLKERAEVERQKAQLEQENQHWQKAAELLGAESPADVTAKLKALREECLSTGEALAESKHEVKLLKGATKTPTLA